MREIPHEAYVIIEDLQKILAGNDQPIGDDAKAMLSELREILDGPRVQRFKKAALNPDHAPEEHASRLAADQARFRKEQFARAQALGVTLSWTVRWDRATGSRQWTWDDRINFETPIYAEWKADVQESGEIVVTRTEYGYLPVRGESGASE